MRFPRFSFYFDVPDAGAGAGAPPPPSPPAPSSAPVAPAGGVPAAAPVSGAGGPAAGAGAGAPASAFTYPEDRSKWIPPYRLDEANRRYQALEGRYRSLDDRIRILMGYDAEAQRDPRLEAVRTQFAQVFPELGPLLQNPQALARVIQLASSGQFDEMSGTTAAYWQRHAQNFSRDIVEAYAKSVGVEANSLGPRALNRIAAQLKAYIEEDRTGERQERYEMGDPTLRDEFVADLTGLFTDPVRRSTNTAAARTVENNRRVPDAGPRGAVPAQAGGGAKPKTRAEIREAARQYVLANR